MVDSSVDRIARALFHRWTRTPVIEFSEAIEDAIFLEAASRRWAAALAALVFLYKLCACSLWVFSNLTGNQVADMSSAEIMKLQAVVNEYNVSARTRVIIIT